jgi:phosphoribosylamine---glycine ligase
MRILIVGSGGREHAIAWAFARSPRVSRIYNASSNAGIRKIADPVDANPTDIESLADFASREKIDLTFVGPEQPLVDGIADLFAARGLTLFGPSASAARLEGSKIFAKEFMERHAIPTSSYRVAPNAQDARRVIEDGTLGFPVVIKADGLAAGKGVVIAANKDQALSAIDDLMVKRTLGHAGDRIVIEEYLEGREVSYLVFADGRTYTPLAVAQDHKRVFDMDQGPNTGGMGAFSMPGLLDDRTEALIRTQIVEPTLEGARQDGMPFRGVLYFGLMLTTNGPSVLEYNVRFGDPETQALVRRLDSDFAEISLAVAQEELERVNIVWNSGSAAAVVMASSGYPGNFEAGKVISGIDNAEQIEGVVVFHAGTSRNRDDEVVTAGGRVLSVTATGQTLDEATGRAYEAVECIHFEGVHFRRDIGRKAQL